MILTLLRNLVEDIIRDISGPMGIRVRRFYYRLRLGSLGAEVTIDTGVYLISPSNIFIGNNCWIDKGVIITAGAPAIGLSISHASDREDFIGKVVIGDNSHIGIGNIIQGHGGVCIGDDFTSSAYCKVYSFSNDPRRCPDGTMSKTASYISGYVEFGRNVWIGLGVSVISAKVGDNVFVKPHSVVYKPIEGNCIAEGNPAEKVSIRFQ